MSAFALAMELLKSGWPTRKLAMIGARYYVGVESNADLDARVEFGEISAADRRFIIFSR